MCSLEVEIFGEFVERLWLLDEVIYVEDGLGIRQIELLEIGVETCARRPEIGNASRDRNTCSGKDEYPTIFALFEALNKILISEIARLPYPQILHQIANILYLLLFFSLLLGH